MADPLAKARMFYPSPLISAPAVMVIDVPTERRGESLPLGRYYPIIVETDAERLELERFISASRNAPALPDLLDHRPSQLWADHVLISRYDPPMHGWPWLCVIRWPEAFARTGAEHGVAMCRGCYTMELFATATAVDAHCVSILEGL